MDPRKVSWMRPWTVPNTTVLYTEQELTEEQQAQARKNIGVGEGGGGGVSSWNDLTDKPFGEEAPKIDITWDGNMEGRIALDMSMLGYDQGLYFVKVSDDVFTTDDVIGWRYVETPYDGESFGREIYSEMIDTEKYPGAFIINDAVVVLYDSEALATALGIPTGIYTNGVYFWLDTESGYLSRLVAPTEIVKIDEKYVPDTIARKADIPEKVSVSWDDITDNPYNEYTVEWKEVAAGSYSSAGTESVTTFNITPSSPFTPTAGTTYKIVVYVSMSGTREIIGVARVEAHPTFSYMDRYVIGMTGDTVRAVADAPKGEAPTTWIITLANPITMYMGANVSFYEEVRTFKPLDEKYLPNLTSPSGKKFKLSVDDNGTITATEV